MGEVFGIHEWETVYVSPASQEVKTEDEYDEWLLEIGAYIYDRLPAKEQKLTSVSDLIKILKAMKWRWNRVRRCCDCGEIVKDVEVYTHNCPDTVLTKVGKGTYMRGGRG